MSPAGRPPQLNFLHYLRGSRPGLLDPTQPDRVLRHPRSVLTFSTYDPQTATGSVQRGHPSGTRPHTPDLTRIVVESVPGTEIGSSTWRFVPAARLAPGVVAEGTWPKFVDLCGVLVLFSQEQWEIYKLDPLYDCYVSAFPDCPVITRVIFNHGSASAARKRQAPSESDGDPSSKTDPPPKKYQKTTVQASSSARNTSKGLSAKAKGKQKAVPVDDTPSVPVDWFTDQGEFLASPATNSAISTLTEFSRASTSSAVSTSFSDRTSSADADSSLTHAASGVPSASAAGRNPHVPPAPCANPAPCVHSGECRADADPDTPRPSSANVAPDVPMAPHVPAAPFDGASPDVRGEPFSKEALARASPDIPATPSTNDVPSADPAPDAPFTGPAPNPQGAPFAGEDSKMADDSTSTTRKDPASPDIPATPSTND
ncbi:hypothetical protein OH76DRAFT_1487982, partial [Lentinus brumalis]